MASDIYHEPLELLSGVYLYLTESFAFRVLDRATAVYLNQSAARSERVGGAAHGLDRLWPAASPWARLLAGR